MSNTEPDAGGTQNFFRSMFQRNTQINAMAGSEIKIAGLEEATSQMSALNSELKGLVQSLTGLSQQQAQLTSGISATMKTIASNAQQTSSAVEGVTSSVGRFRSGAMSIASIFGSAVNSNFVKDLAMFPLRYITGATEQARNIGMGVSTSLGGQMYATGQQQEHLMQMMSRFPGGVQGGVEDIIGLMSLQRQYGAMLDPQAEAHGRGQPNPRAVGMLRGIAEMQAMTPGVPVAALAQTVGQYAANTQAQQQSAYLTGGAFAMIGAGGRQKSISEWAEAILRWLEGQRPGDQRGKGFNYGELMAQYFPGSNIDAWLSQNGVPEGMKEYWWNYALAKSRLTGTTTTDLIPVQGGGQPQPFRVAPVNTGPGQGGNQAFGRLQAASAQARGQFKLGGSLSGMFANKETANQWFNEIIAQVMSDVIPKQIASGSLQAMGVMPDPIQELLMTFLERSGTLGAALGGYIGYGTQGLSGLNAGVFQSLFGGGLPSGAFDPGFMDAFAGNPNLSGMSDIKAALEAQGIALPSWLADLLPEGDVGDVGWTSRGSTSTAGLHPTVRQGIERMIGDNPNIRVNSGLRDTVQQRRLRAAGNSRVSGKPSAHTRGLAADLGPRSQYGWIVANASRYGLQSGVSHGEPWHVGLPGIGDPVETVTGGLGSLFDMFKMGFTKDQAIAGIGSLIPTLLNVFLGTFVGAEGLPSDLSSIAYDPGLYAALRKAAEGPSGLISAGGTYQNKWPDTSSSSSDSTSSDSTDTVVPENARSLVEAAISGGAAGGRTRAEVEKMSPQAVTALLGKKAGWSGNDLVTALRIISRESGFNPGAFNGNRGTGDQSYGLMQINMIDTLGPSRRSWFGIDDNEDLKDPLINLMSGFKMDQSGRSSRGKAFYDWGPYKGKPPTYDAKITEAQARAFITEAGIGDAEAAAAAGAAYSMSPTVYASMAPTTGGDGRVVMFNNTFNISGGGGGQGIDVRRTVTMMAEQLEGEMRKRLARSN